MAELRTNGDRLWQSLAEMAKLGATPAGGNKRLALSDEDKAGRELFVSWAREAGCEISIDSMGNIFARRPGTQAEAEPVMSGSHLDTQPTGGRFDGVYGVLAALEVLRSLNDGDVQTARPVEAVVWTNEEGSRFQPAMMGSGVFAGVLDQDRVYATVDQDGKSVGDELERIGYKGDLPAQARSIHAYLEAHIEQGPVLEEEGSTIGVVTGIQGMKWLKATVRGMNAHAGTTPMEVRRDPLLGAARMVDAIDRTTRALRPDAVATVGEFSVGPGSINVINQEVRFSIDIRCPDEPVLEEQKKRVLAACGEISGDMGLELDIEEIWHVPPTVFHGNIVDAVEEAASALGLPGKRMISGAGHDAKCLAEICPTGMIFIPCKDGISHNETEDILQEHATAGADVLLHTMLLLAG
ncbi:MAG: Zn-dependent hydrolase [SAR324 cluster bacterium]|nr:Zn-dependent hydrolase [SAR324 cluster bacterium]